MNVLLKQAEDRWAANGKPQKQRDPTFLHSGGASIAEDLKAPTLTAAQCSPNRGTQPPALPFRDNLL